MKAILGKIGKGLAAVSLSVVIACAMAAPAFACGTSTFKSYSSYSSCYTPKVTYSCYTPKTYSCYTPKITYSCYTPKVTYSCYTPKVTYSCSYYYVPKIYYWCYTPCWYPCYPIVKPVCPSTPTCPTKPECPEEKEQVTYQVRYIDIDTGEYVAPAKTSASIEVGTAVTETALEIDGYDLVSEPQVEFTVAEDTVIDFFYRVQAPAPEYGNYEVLYVDADTGDMLAQPKYVEGLEVGTSVVEDAIGIEGYDLVSEAQVAFAVEAQGGQVVFYYRVQAPQTASYTVRYIDFATDVDICSPKVVEAVEIGSTVTEYAIAIDEWTLVSSEMQSIEIQEGNNEIVFKYEQDGDIGDIQEG